MNYYRFFYVRVTDPLPDEEYIGFEHTLTQEQHNFLVNRIRDVHTDPDYECSCLFEAITYALEEFKEKFGFTGQTGKEVSPFVCSTEI